MNNKQPSEVSKFLLVTSAVLILTGAFAAGIYAKNTFLTPQVLPSAEPKCTTQECDIQHATFDKPAIYLYPTSTTDVSVKLDYKGRLTSSYPAFDSSINGWNVTASPDGALINDKDHKEYEYLFWEGEGQPFNVNEQEGFVVKGSDTTSFLQDKLSALGLTPKEYNEFIVYWLPKMEANPYNFVRFLGKEYTDQAVLSVTPKPDSELRVFMAFKLLQKPATVKEQVLQPFDRHGFSVIEWGGTELNN